jgi:glucose/arabinose dehydrogenase
MLRRLIGTVLCCVAVFAAEPRKPRHDPPDQLFRRAPMAAGSRSIVVALSTNLHLAFDAELCRVHTVWVGGPLNLWGPPYSSAKSPFIADFAGTVVYAFPQIQPKLAAKFRELATSGGDVSFSYTLGNARVRESFSGAAHEGEWEFTRKFAFEETGGETSIEMLLFAESGAEAERPGRGVTVAGTNGVFTMAASDAATWLIRKESVDYETEIITEAGTEKGNPRVRHQGVETRVYLRFPNITKGTLVEVKFGNGSHGLPEQKVPRTSRKTFESAGEVRRKSGDEFYEIEHFPLPPEAELIITGMDVLPNGDLVVCTWVGEVFIVKDATGPVNAARYQRIARGLNEPLGVTAHDGAFYVAQKGELTRLVDSDGDGEIDRFQCVNADWGYSGNYHSYSFGPVVTTGDDFLVFVTGQRGRADLLYQGWALQISGATGEATPWCDGLRVPHGFGRFGGDVFVTDNQGNWIGACKLNPIMPGKFYGFPSSRPSPHGPRAAEEVADPALWFPRALSPSASGFDTVMDERFGPFKGQLMIGDFQNAIVMRAFLEKVDGTWQGAVFPFAKGFLSGVNRLKMNRDGKLYVGGGKRAWSTAAPSEYSLDRVRFTGRTPFEVQEIRVESDGFTLLFTKPLDREVAADPENYLVKQFTYRYHADYGSPEFDHEGKPGATEVKVTAVTVSDDARSARLVILGLKTGYVTSFQLAVTSADDEDPRNDTFFYTLNRLPAPR